jgi:putative heme iron utilization protein
MSANTKKVYRLALYGLPASGKTCMLAALAMPRYPHPLGYTCIWLPPIDAPKAGKQDKRLMNLYTSKEWLEKAIHKLSVQDLPEPNPASDEYFSFEYDFTASTHQTFRIEIIDYSGELINPVISNSTLAKNLRQKFTTMDGILVLAEAPYRDRLGHVQSAQKSRDGQTHTDLYQLQQTFSLLRGEKQEGAALDFPVALLVNKWDRYSNIDYANQAKEQSKLEEFINSNPPPPHKGVHDVLRFSVAEGNFKMFPVSALGDNEFVRLDNGDVLEHPKQVNPLNAFTLEDAFIWLAQRRDAIDFQQFVEKGTLNKKCKKTGLELLNRFPKDSEPATKIHTILHAYQKTKTRRIIYTLIAIVALWFVTETTMDFRNYHQHIVAINNPHTTHEQLEEAETWLSQYVAAPYFRHLISRVFLSSREQAQKTLTELQTHREKFLWEPVAIALKANDLPAAKASASEYLKYFPLGEHAQKAREIKLNAEIPPRESQTDWENFVKTYTDYMNNGNFKQAAKWLLDRKPETAELKQLKENFETSVIKTLEEKVTIALKEARFEKAWRLLEEYANLPSSLQTVDGTQKIAVLREQVKTSVIKTIEEKVTVALKEARFEEALGLIEEYANSPSSLQTVEGTQKIAVLRELVKTLVIQTLEEQITLTLKEARFEEAWRILQGYANPSSSLQTVEGFSAKIAALQEQVKTSAIKTLEQQVNIALKEARFEEAWRILQGYANPSSSLQTVEGFSAKIVALQEQVKTSAIKTLEQQVNIALKEARFDDAWRLLQGYANPSSSLQTLDGFSAKIADMQKQVKTSAIKTLEEKVTRELKEARFDDALGLIKEYANSPSSLQTVEGTQKIAVLREQVKTSAIKTLEEQITHALKEARFEEAWRVLQDYANPSSSLQTLDGFSAKIAALQKQVKTSVIKTLEEKVMHALKEERFDDAWRLLQGYANPSSSLQTLDGFSAKIADMQKQVKTSAIKTIEQQVTLALKEARFEEALRLLQGYANPSSSLQTLDGFSAKIADMQKQVKTSAIKTIEQQVTLALKEARFEEALRLLQGYANPSSSLQTVDGFSAKIAALQKQVKTSVIKTLEEKVMHALKEERFDEAWRVLQDYANPSSSLQTLDGFSAKIAALQKQVKTSVIKTLEEKVMLALKEARFDDAWRVLQDYANPSSSLQTLEGFSEKIAALQKQVKTSAIKTLEEKVTLALKEARFDEALDLIAEYANSPSSLQTVEGTQKIAVLREQVKTSAIKTIEQQVNIALKKARFDDALSALKEYDNYPSSLRTKTGRKTINALQKQVNRNKDKSLYEQLRKRPNAVRIQKYLKNAPLKTMAKNVSAYKAYLDSTKPKAKLNIRLKLVEIHWKNVDDDDNTVSVELKEGEKTLISSTYKANAKPNTVTKNIGITQKFSATPSMPLSIKVKVVNESMMSMFNDDYGEGSVTMPVSKLAKGYYRMALYNEKKVKTATVYLKIIDYPTEPRLPKWRSSIK